MISGIILFWMALLLDFDRFTLFIHWFGFVVGCEYFSLKVSFDKKNSRYFTLFALFPHYLLLYLALLFIYYLFCLSSSVSFSRSGLRLCLIVFCWYFSSSYILPTRHSSRPVWFYLCSWLVMCTERTCKRVMFRSKHLVVQSYPYSSGAIDEICDYYWQ